MVIDAVALARSSDPYRERHAKEIPAFQEGLDGGLHVGDRMKGSLESMKALPPREGLLPVSRNPAPHLLRGIKAGVHCHDGEHRQGVSLW